VANPEPQDGESLKSGEQGTPDGENRERPTFQSPRRKLECRSRFPVVVKSGKSLRAGKGGVGERRKSEAGVEEREDLLLFEPGKFGGRKAQARKDGEIPDRKGGGEADCSCSGVTRSHLAASSHGIPSRQIIFYAPGQGGSRIELNPPLQPQARVAFNSRKLEADQVYAGLFHSLQCARVRRAGVSPRNRLPLRPHDPGSNSPLFPRALIRFAEWRRRRDRLLPPNRASTRPLPGKNSFSMRVERSGPLPNGLGGLG